MDEYIKREYAVDAAVDVYYNTPDIDLSCEKFEAAILKIPPSDVKPVRHGRWVPALHVGDCCYRCSECQFLRDAYLLDIGNYCPNCGAKMDGD